MIRLLSLAFLILFVAAPGRAARGKAPTVNETEKGRELVLTSDLKKFLNKEFPGSRVPNDSEFNPKMLSYYFTQLIGIHPAIAWGDFNGDRKQDYILLLVTGDTPWGPLVELVILDGAKGGYEAHRLGEIYQFKDDYVSFVDKKLYKGKYQKGGWYINWNKKENRYVIHKS